MSFKKLFFPIIFLVIAIQIFAQNKQNCLVDKVNNNSTMTSTTAKNVLGTPLQSCCFDPITGYFRDGFCHTSDRDYGTHVICAIMTEEFLTFTKGKGNDLSTPIPMYNFPGLKVGDRWCLCALRWKEAMDNGVAPPIILESTHSKALQFITFEELNTYALIKQ